MYRQKSKSKLSSTDLKKLKKTIRDALGKGQPKQNNFETPLKRSQTVKSLTSTQTKKIQTPYTTLTRNNSSKKTLLNQVQSRRKSLCFQNNQKKNDNTSKIYQLTIQSSRWWHLHKQQLQSQKKLQDSGKKKVNLQYFASYNKESKKKTLILAIQNDQIFVSDSKFECYGLDFKDNIYDKVGHRIKVKKYSHILVIGYNQKQKQQFSLLEYYKKTNFQQNQFFNRLVKSIHTKQSKINFYLLLKIKQQKLELKQWPLQKKIFKK